MPVVELGLLVIVKFQLVSLVKRRRMPGLLQAQFLILVDYVQVY